MPTQVGQIRLLQAWGDGIGLMQVLDGVRIGHGQHLHAGSLCAPHTGEAILDDEAKAGSPARFSLLQPPSRPHERLGNLGLPPKHIFLGW